MRKARWTGRRGEEGVLQGWRSDAEEGGLETKKGGDEHGGELRSMMVWGRTMQLGRSRGGDVALDLHCHRRRRPVPELEAAREAQLARRPHDQPEHRRRVPPRVRHAQLLLLRRQLLSLPHRLCRAARDGGKSLAARLRRLGLGIRARGKRCHLGLARLGRLGRLGRRGRVRTRSALELRREALGQCR